jgi:glycosyltransferase involved in cell wall biosynthesis
VGLASRAGSVTSGTSAKLFIVVQAPARPVSLHEFAVESAFAGHLLQLRELFRDEFDEVVFVGPAVAEADQAAMGASLRVLDTRECGVSFLPAFDLRISRARFLLTQALPLWLRLRRLFLARGVLLSGMSTELARPLMLMSCLAARSRGRKVGFYVDIDFRLHAQRMYRTGLWGLRSYLVNRFLYQPFLSLQLHLAPRLFALCCYKGSALVRDFGNGRPNVRNFFDTAFSADDLLSPEEVQRKATRALDRSRPLHAVYFGRLAQNKGIDRMIRAVGLAREAGADVRLTLIGDGACRDDLVSEIRALGLSECVRLEQAVPYGLPLFRMLDDADVSLAAPLIEDTPRSAFDSLARGLPVIAFDTGYFTDIAGQGGAVITSPWPEEQGLADTLALLARDRDRLATLTRQAVAFAADNTQEIWLRRRMQWLRDVPDLQ